MSPPEHVEQKECSAWQPKDFRKAYSDVGGKMYTLHSKRTKVTEDGLRRLPFEIRISSTLDTDAEMHIQAMISSLCN